MSRLRKEIKLNMSGLRDDGQELTAQFSFSKEFSGFKGHFPDKPIFPGVCKVQAILCILEEATRKKPRLKEIVSAKFFKPITYNEEIVCKVRRVSESSEEALVSTLITSRDKKIAEIKIKVVFEG
ncbi:MAG: hypothetical protein HQ547_00940 [Candidatus Omnitrophica bacterium]|nr:hypothetical protein [Candidatus Omnitrophota bacterium]